MPDRTAVVAFVKDDDTASRQERAILRFCNDQRLRVVSICNDPKACAQLVAAGIATLVIAAVDHRIGLRAAVVFAGGSVIFVRSKTQAPTLREWLRRAVGKGVSPSAIAAMVDESTDDVSGILRDMGINPPKSE